MPGFTTHSGKTAVYASDQVDTDRIIPARFLTRVSRFGYGELLFADVRGAEFPLDQPEASGASILVVGLNFGCGSSREHAVWALQQAGFVVVLSKSTETTPGFSDIFRQNAQNCGLLVVELKAEDHDKLVQLGSGAEISVDLPNQEVRSQAGVAKFEIAPATKSQMLAGLDLVGSTLQHEAAISEFESRWSSFSSARS